MTTLEERSFRIGEVAEQVGVTTRTIRYYEELGLLGGGAERTKGAHRLYGQADVVRLQGLIRLRDLLGLSLEELVEIAEAEEARAALREEWASDPTEAERARIVAAAIPLVERQLELVRARQQTLADFAAELAEKLDSLRLRASALSKSPQAKGRSNPNLGSGPTPMAPRAHRRRLLIEGRTATRSTANEREFGDAQGI